jgi:hypothetical protein
MNRPSALTLRLGELLFDYVPYGLTQVSAIQELAEMVDKANRALLAAISAVLQDAQRNGGVPTAFSVAQLRQGFADYEPIVWSSDFPGELAGIGSPALGRGPAKPVPLF